MNDYDYIGEFNQGIAIVIKNEKFGAMVMGGKEIIPPTFQYIAPFDNGFADAIKNDKFVKINMSGNICIEDDGELIAIPEQYDEVKEFHEGIASVCKDGQWGAIDRQGKEIVECKYQWISNCNRGFVIAQPHKQNYPATNHVYSKDGHLLFERDGEIRILSEELLEVSFGKDRTRLNREGKIIVTQNEEDVVLEEQYDAADAFQDGYCHVMKNDGWGMIDSNQELVIPCEYDEVTYYINGYCRIKVGGKWGLVNQAHQLILPCQYDSISEYKYGYSLVRDGRNWKLLLGNGTLKDIPGKYYNVEIISERYLGGDNSYLLTLDGEVVALQPGCSFSRFDEWNVLISKNQRNYPSSYKEGIYLGNEKKEIQPCYNKILKVNNGTVEVELPNGKNGVVSFDSEYHYNSDNEEILFKYPCVYITERLGDCFIAVNMEDLIGVIDKDGRAIVPYKYTEVKRLNENLLVFTEARWNEKYLFNTQFKKVSDSKFSQLYIEGDLVVGKYDGQYGLFSSTGERLQSNKYQSIEHLSNGLFLVKHEEKIGYGIQSIETTYGLLSALGKELFPCVFDSIDKFDNGIAKAIKDREQVTIDEKGNYLIRKENGEYIPVPKQYCKAEDFVGGLAEVTLPNYVDGWCRTFLIDENLQPAFLSDGKIVHLGDGIDAYCPFLKNNKFTKFRRNGKLGIIDRSGNIIIDSLYDQLTYGNGFFVGIQHKESKKVVFDEFGMLYDYGEGRIIDIHCSTLGDNPSEYSLLGIIRNKKMGVINSKTKEVIIEPKYDEIRYRYNYLSVRIGEQWGVCNLDGREIIPCSYDLIESLEQDFYKLFKLKEDITDDKTYAIDDLKRRCWQGVADRDGNVVLNPIYQKIEKERGDYFAWDHGNKHQLDKNFRIIERKETQPIEVHRSETIKEGPFEHGITIVYTKEQHGNTITNQNYGLLDERGNEALPPIYDYISRVETDYYEIHSNRNECNVMLIKYDGQEVFSMSVDDRYSFGLFYSRSEYHYISFCNNRFIIRNGKYGLYDKDGRCLAGHKYDLIDKLTDHTFLVTADGKKGIVDLDGNELVSPSFSRVHGFKDGISIVDNGHEKEDEDGDRYYVQGQLGIIRDDGVLISNLKFETIGEFTDGIAPVSYEYRDDRDSVSFHETKLLDGFINKDGLFVKDQEGTPFGFDISRLDFICTNKENPELSTGIIRHKSLFLKGTYNNKGKQVVSTVDLTKKWSNPISKKTLIEIENPNRFAFDSENRNIIYLEDGLYGVLDANQQILIPNEYDEIKASSIDSNKIFYIVQKNGLYGLVSEGGDVEIPLIYQELLVMNTHLEDKSNDCFDSFPNDRQIIFRSKKEGLYGLISSLGETILPTSYNQIEEVDNFFVVSLFDENHECKESWSPAPYKKMLFSPSGNWVTEAQFDGIDFIGHGYFVGYSVDCSSGYSRKKYGYVLINQHGIQDFPFEIDEILPFGKSAERNDNEMIDLPF